MRSCVSGAARWSLLAHIRLFTVTYAITISIGAHAQPLAPGERTI